MRHFSVASFISASAALLCLSGAAMAQGLSQTQVVPYDPLPSSNPFATKIFAMSPAIACPPVIVDTSAAPECAAWAQEAKLSVEEWFPIVSQFLDTETWKPPKTITLVFKPMDGVAYTAGSVTTINSKYVVSHQSDFGMVIHEMTHIIQGYPDRGDKPGWIVEGMADYIRYWRYEPDTIRYFHFYADSTDYHHGYAEAGAFLAWIIHQYDRRLIFELDGALKTGSYTPQLWNTYTGKSFDDLWAEYLKTLPAHKS